MDRRAGRRTGGSRLSAARFFITGRVQGVFFRESTARKARRLDLTGYAVNLDDGRVEVLAVGEASRIDALGRWLHDGPPMARVDAVERRTADDEDPGEFSTGWK